MKKASSIKEYIAGYEGEARARLERIRKIFASVFPKAEQLIRYNMPAFRVGDADVVYFAGYKKHVSVMPTPFTIQHFAGRLKDHTTTDHAIQFQNAEPLPSALIKEMALWNKKALKNGTLYQSSK